jgi:hypothetical protein
LWVECRFDIRMTLQRLSNIYQEFNFRQSICIQKQKRRNAEIKMPCLMENGIWTQWALSNFAMSVRWSPVQECEMGSRVILLRAIRRFDHRCLIFPFDRWINNVFQQVSTLYGLESWFW